MPLNDNKKLSDIWKLKKRGKLDSDRHKELVKRAIKKNSGDIITNYDVITTDGKKKIKVKIKLLEQYKVKHGKSKNQSGTGHGIDVKSGKKYKIGDKGKESGTSASDQDGERLFEEDVSLDEIVDILLEELELPWMNEKNKRSIVNEVEEISSVEKKGILPNLDIKRTILQNIKRNAMLGDPRVKNIVEDDFRYRSWDVQVEEHSNAAVYLMMDCSGSMTKNKRDIAKVFYFWMVQFLRRKYENIKVYFILHDTTANFVEESDFFKVSRGGGTVCSSAFKLSYDHIKKHHPKDSWNNYVFEISDGDNWKDDNPKCLKIIKKMLPLVRAIGYAEVIFNEELSLWKDESALLSEYLNKNIQRTRFLSTRISSKDAVFDNLKSFFNIKSEV